MSELLAFVAFLALVFAVAFVNAFIQVNVKPLCARLRASRSRTSTGKF